MSAHPSPRCRKRDRRLWQKLAAVNRAEKNSLTARRWTIRGSEASRESACDAPGRHGPRLRLRAAAAEQRLEKRHDARLVLRRSGPALRRAAVGDLVALALLRRFDHAALALD